MEKQRSYKQIPAIQTPDLLQRGAVMIDVRRPEEWELTGTVAGSILLTFFDADGNSDPQSWLAEVNRQVPPDIPLALI